MRNLTIKREKSFVACLAKMKIYIEDYASFELTINDIPCRKIGELKNGEEKTFQIGEQAAKVFVIADKMSKNFCNEYYQLVEGQEDIVLTGKNKYNLANGNAFRFDNNENVEALDNRKRGTRKGVVLLLIAAIVGGVIGALSTSGILSSKPEEKSFSSNGMTITLTDEFVETDSENHTAAFTSKKVSVLALKEEFASFEGFGNYTLGQYADLVINANKFEGTQWKTLDGLVWFEYDYTNPETNATYKHYAYEYKSDDAFWLIVFVVHTENAEEYAQHISDWAKSVSFE